MTTKITNPTRITHDDIMDRKVARPTAVASFPHGGMFAIITEPDADGAVFGQGTRSGQIVRIVRTGRVVRADGQVRVAVQTATDTGDAAGTLSFNREDRGAVAPAVAFKA